MRAGIGLLVDVILIPLLRTSCKRYFGQYAAKSVAKERQVANGTCFLLFVADLFVLIWRDLRSMEEVFLFCDTTAANPCTFRQCLCIFVLFINAPHREHEAIGLPFRRLRTAKLSFSACLLSADSLCRRSSSSTFHASQSLLVVFGIGSLQSGSIRNIFGERRNHRLPFFAN